MSARRTRGNYYVNAHLVREDGKRFGWQVARQVRTLREAREALDNFSREGFHGRGYIQLWSDETQRRYIVAERDEAGNWWGYDGITDTLRAMPAIARA